MERRESQMARIGRPLAPDFLNWRPQINQEEWISRQIEDSRTLRADNKANKKSWLAAVYDGICRNY
jgi:hypothetical protein